MRARVLRRAVTHGGRVWLQNKQAQRWPARSWWIRNGFKFLGIRSPEWGRRSRKMLEERDGHAARLAALGGGGKGCSGRK